jgi:hypothetical protein
MHYPGGFAMAITGQIEIYRLQIWTTHHEEWTRRIFLRGGFGSATLNFVPEESTLPKNQQLAEDLFDVHFWERAWDPIVDMLRNEDTTQFFFRDSDNVAMIFTGEEPIGEEES